MEGDRTLIRSNTNKEDKVLRQNNQPTNLLTQNSITWKNILQILKLNQEIFSKVNIGRMCCQKMCMPKNFKECSLVRRKRIYVEKGNTGKYKRSFSQVEGK